MTKRADILIIGAGVIGASVAWHLAQRGASNVVVVDRAPDLGGGSTPRATGGFRAQFDNETEIRMSMLARKKLLAFEEEIGCDSGYRPYGYLFLACNDAELEELRRVNAIQRACGLDDARIIDADEARAINPAIGDARVIGGAYCASDGFIRAMNILRGYAGAAKKLGVRFEFGVEKSVAEALEEARIVVNAAGAWSGAPVTPLRRKVAATIETNILPESMPMTIWSGDWYHIRVRDGRVLLLWPDDPPSDETWYDELLRMTNERVPILRDVAVDFCWSGFYEMSPDERAIVGRSPQIENLYLATGCSGHGVMHSPAIGQLVAELILDGTTSIDISALSPSRFV